MHLRRSMLMRFVSLVFELSKPGVVSNEKSSKFQASEYQETLSLPEGRIHFAGEHTDTPHAWIDTSIRSGVREDG